MYTWHFQNVVCLFCNVNFTRDIKNFGQILILVNKTKIVEKHKKDRPHFGNSKTKDTLCLLETLEFYC